METLEQTLKPEQNRYVKLVDFHFANIFETTEL